MILIVKSQEPQCLTDLKDQGFKNYDDLQGTCRKEVKTQLKADQKSLCAYCQKSVGKIIKLEHYLPQKSKSGKDKVLDYDNFLGVCTGQYLLERLTNKKIDYCEHLRGSKSITIDVTKKDHIESIYYDENFQIKSRDKNIQHDLDETLNLNFDELCLERRYAFDDEEVSVRELAVEMGLSPLQAYSKAIRSVQQRNPEYSGYLLFEFKRKVEHYSSKL